MHTLNQLNDVLKTIATEHGQIFSYGLGDNWEIGRGKLHYYQRSDPQQYVYPLMWCELQPFNRNDKNYFRKFRLFFMDLVHTDEKNELEIQSDMEQVALDVLAKLLRGDNETNFLVEKGTTIEIFPLETFEENVAGCFMDVSLKLPFLSDECAVPLKVAPNYFQKAINFEAGEYLTIAASSILEIEKFTIEAWVKAGDILGSYKTIFEKLSDNFGLYQELGDEFKIYFTELNGTSHELGSATPITVGTWYHVVGTFDGLTFKMFVNGIEKASDVLGVASILKSELSEARIGGGSGDDDLVGAVDELRIYDRAISSTEINYSYNGGLGRNPQNSTGLKLNLKFNDDLLDSSGNGLNAVAVGSPDFISH